MLTDQLQDYGLTEHEAAVYAALLELGPSSILHVAQKTGLNRSALYTVVEGLMAKKLIAETPVGKRRHFAAEPPEKLKLLLKEKLAGLNDLLPELVTLGNAGKTKPVIRYYEGIEGIKTVYLGVASAQEKVGYGFAGVERLLVRSRALETFWEGPFKAARMKNGVLARLIVPDNEEGKAFASKNAELGRESRFVPASTYNFPSEIFIYDSTTAFISYTKDEEFAMSLESKAIAETMKMVWKITWTSGY